MNLKKGDILTAVDVQEDEAGSLVLTDAGVLLGVRSARGVKAGAKMQVGPVCGDWCRVFLLGESYQAQILQRSSKSS